MFFELYLKHAQNGESESDRNASLGPQLTSYSSNAALNQKKKIPDSQALISYVENLYRP